MAEEPYLKCTCVVKFILICLIYEEPETERWDLQGFFLFNLGKCCSITESEVKSRPQRRANTCSSGHRHRQHLRARGRRAAKRPQTSLLHLRAFLAEASALAKDVYLGNSQHLRKLRVFSRSWSLRPRIVRVRGTAGGVRAAGKALRLCSPV